MFANIAKSSSSIVSEIPIADSAIPDILDGTAMLKDLENRLSVRFFLKRSKKFHYDRFGRDLIKEREDRKNRRNPRNYSIEKRNLNTGGESVLSIDILRDLEKLSAQAEKQKLVQVKKQRSVESTNFEFSKPKVFNCHKCSKLFFHKLPHRRHMIFHMSNTQHCKKCNKAFAIKSDRRKHEAVCNNRKIQCTNPNCKF